ncbi:MAG: HAMP domain-containing protein [Clostridiales bacterium]|nr:HAMP domain-containing protein [Clostridiales bacterium]
MFILIFSSIIILFSFIAMFQYVYYQNFYENSKIKETAHNLETYVTDYTDEQWTLEEQLIQAKNFNIENNAFLDVMQLSSNETIAAESIITATPLFENMVIVTAMDSDNAYFDFLLAEEDFDKIFNDSTLTDAMSIVVSGVIDNYQTIYPSVINATEIVGASVLPESTDVFSGTLSLVEIYNPASQAIVFSSETNNINIGPVDSVFEEGQIGDIEYVVTTMSNTSIKQVNFYYQKQIDGEEHIFVVNLSLQSVTESMAIYQEFLPLLIVTTLLIALVVSIIYSKQVSRPIVEITHVANSMSNLNFDKSLPDQREDELGVLSRSINTLSDSLNKSLQELSEANIKLTEDYENEVKQELIRKNFVANVSHEIKTPLGIIKSYAEGIKDVVKKEKQEYYIDVIIDEINRMDILLNELLELSKLDSGHAVYDLKPTDVENIIKKLVKHHEYLLEQNNLRIKIFGQFETIQADYEKIYRAFNNLIGNAIKYAIPGSTIEIEGILSDHFTLEFRNDCEPLSEEQNEQIWHRFYKADESHNRDVEGNGLGLSIIKSIMEGHHFSSSSVLTDTGISFKIEMPRQIE